MRAAVRADSTVVRREVACAGSRLVWMSRQGLVQWRHEGREQRGLKQVNLEVRRVRARVLRDVVRVERKRRVSGAERRMRMRREGMGVRSRMAVRRRGVKLRRRTRQEREAGGK